MATLRKTLKRIANALFPPPPAHLPPRPKTIAKMVSEGYREFRCTRTTYSALVNLVAPADATGAEVVGLFGVTIVFRFNSFIREGFFVPVEFGCLLQEEAFDV